MKIISFISIKFRLRLLIFVILLLIVNITSVVIYQNLKVGNHFKIFYKVNEPSITLYLISKEQIAMSYSTLLNFASSQNQDEKRYFNDYINSSENSLKMLKQKFDSLEITKFHSTIDSSLLMISRYRTEGNKYFEIPLNIKSKNIDSLLRIELNSNYAGFFWGIYGHMGIVQNIFIDFKNEILKTSEEAVRFTIIFSIVSSLICILISFFASASIISQINKSFLKIIDIIKRLAKGELVTEGVNREDELGEVLKATNLLSDNLYKASNFAAEIGKGQFITDFTPVSDQDILGHSLVSMQKELKKFKEEDSKRDWTNQGLAKFSELLRTKANESIEEVGNLFLKDLVRYLGINQGALFILEKSEENVQEQLVLKACYAYDRKKFLDKTILVGEGLVGQVCLEKEPIYMTEIPKDYIYITSGLGQAEPNAIFIVPLLLQEEIHGVIELASFNEFEPHHQNFVIQVAQALASAINVNKVSENTKKLLALSRIQAETSQNQEEEMRQNLEEMTATQEEFARKETEFEQFKTKMLLREQELLAQLSTLKSEKVLN